MAYKKRSAEEIEVYQKQQDLKKMEFGEKIKRIAESFEHDPTTLAEFIEFKNKFYNYSYRNTMMIYMQNSRATFVGSFNKFKELGNEIAEEMGTKDYFGVKKGEKGLSIFVPVEIKAIKAKDSNTDFVQISKANKELLELYKKGQCEIISKTAFKLGNVFDISQTQIPVEKYPKIYGMGVESELHAECIDILKHIATEKGIDVRDVDFKSIALRGTASIHENKINLNEKLKDTQKLATLAHEIGHKLMKHGLDESKPVTLCEVEADAFSIQVLNHLGFETTDVTKSHLSTNFKSFVAEHKAMNNNAFPHDDFDKSINNVSKAFQGVLENINQILDKSISLSENKIIKPIKPVSAGMKL